MCIVLVSCDGVESLISVAGNALAGRIGCPAVGIAKLAQQLVHHSSSPTLLHSLQAAPASPRFVPLPPVTPPLQQNPQQQLQAVALQRQSGEQVLAAECLLTAELAATQQQIIQQARQQPAAECLRATDLA